MKMYQCYCWLIRKDIISIQYFQTCSQKTLCSVWILLSSKLGNQTLPIWPLARTGIRQWSNGQIGSQLHSLEDWRRQSFHRNSLWSWSYNLMLGPDEIQHRQNSRWYKSVWPIQGHFPSYEFQLHCGLHPGQPVNYNGCMRWYNDYNDFKWHSLIYSW